MPETFLATVKSYRSDEHGQATICFVVPEEARTPASEVGKWTEQVLSVTVCKIKELKTHAKVK
jgi:hypothetical protein